jgi:hypothetical protein
MAWEWESSNPAIVRTRSWAIDAVASALKAAAASEVRFGGEPVKYA